MAQNLQLIESKRFILFWNEESEFWILLSLPLLTGLWLERFLFSLSTKTTLSTFLVGRNTRRKRTTFGRALTSVKPVFHFNRIVAKRSVFYCVHIISSARVFTKQWNTVCFATIRLKWKTDLTLNSPE